MTRKEGVPRGEGGEGEKEGVVPRGEGGEGEKEGLVPRGEEEKEKKRESSQKGSAGE